MLVETLSAGGSIVAVWIFMCGCAEDAEDSPVWERMGHASGACSVSSKKTLSLKKGL